ncbi:hypothetical protein BDF14DRAFT_1723342 [Spinellus fusiger]|nr:hypothetical protein BDF14DRAFT_1723342 [Spinellus fusiger]
MAIPNTSRPLQERLLTMVKNLQFLWFVGHVFTLFGAFSYVLSTLTFGSSTKGYTAAYIGALISYGVVIYKSHGIPQPSIAFAQKLAMDENAQYLLLSLYWLFSSDIAVSLVPYVSFSAFHTIGYIRTSIIPTVFPVPAGTATNASWQTTTQSKIKAWTDANYGPAMRFVAQVEVVGIMGRLLLGLFKLRIMSIFVFAQFLRFRYHMSAYTRQSFGNLRERLDRFLLPPTADARIPPMVSSVYTSVKGMIIRYGQAIVQQQPTPAR